MNEPLSEDVRRNKTVYVNGVANHLTKINISRRRKEKEKKKKEEKKKKVRQRNKTINDVPKKHIYSNKSEIEK